jgi:hypothetical protein
MAPIYIHKLSFNINIEENQDDLLIYLNNQTYSINKMAYVLSIPQSNKNTIEILNMIKKQWSYIQRTNGGWSLIVHFENGIFYYANDITTLPTTINDVRYDLLQLYKKGEIVYKKIMLNQIDYC